MNYKFTYVCTYFFTFGTNIKILLSNFIHIIYLINCKYQTFTFHYDVYDTYNDNDNASALADRTH